MTGNRLTKTEASVLTAARLWWRHRTPENLRHLSRAIKEYIRSAETVEAA